MVFRITTTAGALAAHTGPMGTVPWKWYVTRPVVDEDLTFSTAPMLPTLLEPQHHEPTASLDHTPPPMPPGAMPPEEPNSDDEGHEHEAAPGPSAPGDRRVVEVPLSITAKADKVKRVLHDAGQPTAWIDQLMLGLARQYETECAWNERDKEGRMRGAWDEVEQFEPTTMLRAVPNGARANTALLMSQLYKAAAPCAHSLTASRGWIAEAIRMGNRARALKTCSALTRTELEDWTSPSRVKASAGVTEKNISMALAAGVPASGLLGIPPVRGKGKLVADEEAWNAAKTGAQMVEQSTTTEFEQLVKLAYDSGEANSDMVIELLAYAPAWLPGPSKSAKDDDSNPADATPPVQPAPEIAPVVDSPEADKHVAIGGTSIAVIKEQLIPGKDQGPSGFGSASPPTTMSQGMPQSTTSTPDQIATTPQTNKDNTPHSTPTTDATTQDAQATARMSFTE